MAARRSQLENRLRKLGIVYHEYGEFFDSPNGLVEVEAILAALPDCCVNDVAEFVESKRKVHYRSLQSQAGPKATAYRAASGGIKSHRHLSCCRKQKGIAQPPG